VTIAVEVAGLSGRAWPKACSHRSLGQRPNLYASEIDPAFERPRHLGLFHDHTTASPDNVAQMSPCFLEANGKIYMYTNIGPRLNQKIALAVAEVTPER
jgi:hypothetical protein